MQYIGPVDVSGLLSMIYTKNTLFVQKGQVALDCSPEFCLKLLSIWYLLKTHVMPLVTQGQAIYAAEPQFEQI